MKIPLSVFLGKTDSSLIQMIRYTVVGGLAFMFDFGALYFFTEYLHLHYLASAAIAFIIGLLVNYFLSIMWVFNSRVIKSQLYEFAIFLAIGIIGLAFNELLLWVFTSLLLFYYLVSKIITAVLVYLWNFLMRKYILFKNY
jgi:putative flippase GtrA